MTDNIPYVITEAHPDYKRPWFNQRFGSINETLKDTFFVKKIAEFIYDNTDIDDIITLDFIEKFWKNYYQDSFMGNPPWEANIFVNGEWVSICPTNIEILEYFQQINTKLNNDNEDKISTIYEDDKEYNDNEFSKEDDEEYIDYNFSEEEIQIQNDMKQYVNNELDATDLELLTTLGDIEQLIYILNKCILNISSNKYNSNKEIFYKFFNTILKCTQKDIDKTTEKIKNKNNAKLQLKMNNLMNLRNSLLVYNTIYNSFK